MEFNRIYQHTIFSRKCRYFKVVLLYMYVLFKINRQSKHPNQTEFVYCVIKSENTHTVYIDHIPR